MPVRKLFWDDPYATRCDAIVTSVEDDAVTLDRTVAYPFSGGQASDVGTIAGREILMARTAGLEIVYTLSAEHGLSPGDAVEVEIDWPTRYRLMRLHFAAELVLELVRHRHGRPEKLGANIAPTKARIDFAWHGSIAPILPDIARELQGLVEANLPILSEFANEATQQRYWQIDGFGHVPCGGTHLRRTGEVGGVGLKRANPGGGVERIEITLVD